MHACFASCGIKQQEFCLRLIFYASMLNRVLLHAGVAERQTRWLQVPVGISPWRFKSSHPHHFFFKFSFCISFFAFQARKVAFKQFAYQDILAVCRSLCSRLHKIEILWQYTFLRFAQGPLAQLVRAHD